MFIKVDFTTENSHGDTVVNHEWINTDNIMRVTEHNDLADRFRYSLAFTAEEIVWLKEEEFERLKEALKL